MNTPSPIYYCCNIKAQLFLYHIPSFVKKFGIQNKGFQMSQRWRWTEARHPLPSQQQQPQLLQKINEMVQLFCMYVVAFTELPTETKPRPCNADKKS